MDKIKVCKIQNCSLWVELEINKHSLVLQNHEEIIAASAAKKQTLQWAAWTRQKEESFFTALRQVGKAFFADMYQGHLPSLVQQKFAWFRYFWHCPTVRLVDDKYQYSCDDKDNRVHGWICSNPAVGFWMITPSDEFRTGGPVKQDLTSHVGPTTLSMFFSTHYAGDNQTIKLRDGESWKNVFGPILIYLNSVSIEEDALTLWEDAKEQMLIETQSWPYDFPLSEDFPHADQRGTVSG
ncbi:hypothetical protein HYC85_012093 [Camellia sinensis]|uniref:Uncharacterized protein n=1 Tax=Camellia sinensis TaxID=4442 RepID=A0A7J7HAY9_CAMSI|nr:hypothetical protein HYC85_012093 [Camellia sinensis]